MNRFFAGIKILRPLNMILCLLAVLLAAFLIGGLSSPLLFYTLLTVFCFAGASNILNDVLDIRIDRVNRKDRVLPSGQLKILDALIFMSVLYGVGILACTYLQPLGRQIALIAVMPLLILYTPLFKRLPFVGNIVVGSMLGLLFLFSEGALHGKIDKLWIPFLLVTALSAIRELCKDAADMPGDSAENLKTFPRKYGLISTLWLLRILAIALCLFAITPYTSGHYGIVYLVFLILGVEIPLIYTLFIILSEKSGPVEYITAAKILKGITVAGMLVIFSSRF